MMLGSCKQVLEHRYLGSNVSPSVPLARACTLLMGTRARGGTGSALTMRGATAQAPHTVTQTPFGAYCIWWGGLPTKFTQPQANLLCLGQNLPRIFAGARSEQR